jgi:hypothetical protein
MCPSPGLATRQRSPDVTRDGGDHGETLWRVGEVAPSGAAPDVEDGLGVDIVVPGDVGHLFTGGQVGADLDDLGGSELRKAMGLAERGSSLVDGSRGDRGVATLWGR